MELSWINEELSSYAIPEGKSAFTLRELADILGLRIHALRFWSAEMPGVFEQKETFVLRDLALFALAKRLRHLEDKSMEETRSLIEAKAAQEFSTEQIPTEPLDSGKSLGGKTLESKIGNTEDSSSNDREISGSWLGRVTEQRGVDVERSIQPIDWPQRMMIAKSIDNGRKIVRRVLAEL